LDQFNHFKNSLLADRRTLGRCLLFYKREFKILPILVLIGILSIYEDEDEDDLILKQPLYTKLQRR